MATPTAFNTTLLTLALKTAEDFLRAETPQHITVDRELVWTPTPTMPARIWQTRLLLRLVPQRRELDKLIGHKAFVDVDPSKVNQWLAALPSIPLRFQERPVDKSLFYVATYFALRDLHWHGNAQEYDFNQGKMITIGSQAKPGYRLSCDLNGVNFYNIGEGQKHPLAVISTSNPRIKIYCFESEMLEELALLSKVQELRGYVDDPLFEIDDWGGVILPSALVEKDINLGEGKLIGLRTVSYVGQTVSVFEAGMFLRLVLSPDGPMAEGAAKAGFAKESLTINIDPRPDFIFDKDFVFAFVDEEIDSGPIVAAWLPASEFSEKEIRLADFEPKEE